MLRIRLWIGAVGIAAAVSLWIGLPRKATDQRSPAQPPNLDNGAHATEPVATPQPLEESPHRADRASVEVGPEDQGEATPIAAATTSRRLEGTAVAIDESDAEHSSEHGRFTLCFYKSPDDSRARTQEVCVEAGRWSSDLPEGRPWVRPVRLTLGDRRVHLPPDPLPVPDDLTMALSGPWIAAIDPVPLEGTLRVPLAWQNDKLREFTLFLRPWPPDPDALETDHVQIERSEMTRDEIDSELFRWSAGAVTPTTYLADVDPMTYWQFIEVGPEGNSSVRIELPEPCEAAVSVIEELTGKPAQQAHVFWHLRRPDERPSGGETVTWNDSTSCFSFLSLPGEVVIHVGGGMDFVEENHAVSIHEGRTEFLFYARRAQGILANVTVEDRQVGGAGDGLEGRDSVTERGGGGRDDGIRTKLRLRVDAVDHLGREMWKGNRGETRYVTGSEPGLYDVSFSEISGYEPIPSRRVMVFAREFTELTVALRPRR